jgi:hypothetical protein
MFASNEAKKFANDKIEAFDAGRDYEILPTVINGSKMNTEYIIYHSKTGNGISVKLINAGIVMSYVDEHARKISPFEIHDIDSLYKALTEHSISRNMWNTDQEKTPEYSIETIKSFIDENGALVEVTEDEVPELVEIRIVKINGCQKTFTNRITLHEKQVNLLTALLFKIKNDAKDISDLLITK